MSNKLKKFICATLTAITLNCAGNYVESSPVTENAIRTPSITTTAPVSVDEMTPESILRGDYLNLKVGYIADTDFVFEDRPGHTTGYGYEYMEFLSNYAHCNFEYVEFRTWRELSDALNRGDVDVVPGMPGDYRKLENATRTDHVVGRFPMELIIANNKVNPHMRIGTIPDNYPTPGLAGVARGEGFTYDIETFQSYPDMIDAYENGEIDAYIDAMINPHKANNVLAIFDRQSYRLSVRSDNRELLTRLNLAMDQMLLNQSNIRDKLNNKYLRAQGVPLILTRNEKEYLANRKKLRAAIFMYRQPYAYHNAQGELVGVMPEIIKRIDKDLDVEIEIVETRSIAETIELIKNGDVDFVADVFCDYDWAKDINIKPTQSYLTMDYVAVTRSDYVEKPSELPVVACCADMFYTQAFIEPNFPEDKRVYVPTLEDAIKAVNNGRADVVYIQRNLVNALIASLEIYDLDVSSESVYSEPVSIGVYANEEPQLWHILNKEINHIDSDWIRTVVSNNRQAEIHITPKWLLYHHPLRVVFALLALAAAIVWFIVYRNRMRQKHLSEMEHMAYTDLRYDLPNVSWLENEVPNAVQKLSAENPDAKTFFTIFAMSSHAAATKEYGRSLMDKQFKLMAKSLAESEPVLLTAAGIDVEHLICFCKGNSVDEIKTWAEDAIKTFSYMETADANAKVVLHMSAGISEYNPSMNVQQAVDQAVTACHQQGGDDVKVFDEKLGEHLTLQHTIESRMEQALRDGEFKAWYQPKYDIRTRRIIGAEALVRWISPEMGFMPPGKFIPLFEQNGFVIPVDYYLLEKTFQLQKERLEAGKEVVPISVNQSRLHMTEDGYLDKMKAIVEKYNLPEGLIELEVTETVFGDFDAKGGQNNANNIVKSLHDLGFTVSVDDFGSGYSSFMMLGNLPMDVMKIDRSILVGADTSERMRTILGNVIKLGNSLKMKVICEGIETREQEELLLSLGCYMGQGFLNAKPMPVEDFVSFMEKRNAEVDAAG